MPTKTTKLVNLIIMDLLSCFSTELSTWPDISLKTLTKHLCLWRSSSVSDKCYCLHLLSDWTGLGRHWNDGMEQNMSFIQDVSVNSVSHSSKSVWSTSLQYTMLLNHHMAQETKNDHHENLKTYLYLQHYASGGCDVAQWIALGWTVLSSNPSGDMTSCSQLVCFNILCEISVAQKK